MKKKIYKNKLMSKTFNQLRNLAPQAKNIKINYREKPDGKIETKIELRAGKKVHLFAKKTGDNMKEALETAQQAMIRQLHKLKTKNNSKRRTGISQFSHAY